MSCPPHILILKLCCRLSDLICQILYSIGHQLTVGTACEIKLVSRLHTSYVISFKDAPFVSGVTWHCHGNFFEINDVAHSILRQKEVVLSYKDGCHSLETQSLHFEPYHLLTPARVCQLFNPDQPVPATLLHKVVQFCHHSMKPQVYSELREYLDSLSIFAGRNPLVRAVGVVILYHVIVIEVFISLVCVQEVAELKEEDLPSDTVAGDGDPSSILSESHSTHMYTSCSM